MVYPIVKKYNSFDSTFDLSDHNEKNRHPQVIITITVCSAILLMVMLVVGLVLYLSRLKRRKEGNL